MISLRTMLVSSLLLCLLAGAAKADNPYTRSGAYIGAGGVLGIDNFSGASGHELAPGFELLAGYRLNSIFSAEVDVEYLHEFAYTPVTPDNEEKVSFVTFTANLKGHINLEGIGVTPRLQPFGKLGFGFYTARFKAPPFPRGDYDETDAAMRFGAGVDFYLTRSTVLGFEGRYQMLMRQNEALDLFSLGLSLQYRF